MPNDDTLNLPDGSDNTSAPVSQTPQDNTPGAPGIGSKLLGVLSGGLHDSSYQVDPNTGQMSQVQNPTANKPGQMFKNMLTGMLSGLAGAGNAAANGHKGFGAGLSAGIQQNQDRLRQVDQQKREQAQQGFENNIKAQDQQQRTQQLKANMIKAHDDHIASTFEVARQGGELTDKEAQQSEALKSTIQNTPGSKYLGFAKASLDDTVNALKDPTERAQWLKWKAQNAIGSHPVHEVDPTTGQIKLLGNDYYHMEPAYDNKPTEKDTDYVTEDVDDKTGKSSFKKMVIPAGQISNAEARAINTKPLTGAITPAVELENKTKLSEMQHSENMQKTAMQNEWSMMNARFNNETKMAMDKGEIMSPAALNATAKNISEYGGDINTVRFLLKQHPELEGQIKNFNPEWDQRIYTSSQHAMNDYMGGGKTFQNIRAGDTMLQHASALDDLLKSLPNTTNLKMINERINALARQTGNPNISSADTLMEALATERARALHGGVPDKQSVEESRKVMDLSKGPAAVRSALHEAVSIQHQALQSYAGDFQREVPGAAKMSFAPSMSDGATKALDKFGLDDPFNYGLGPRPTPGTPSIADKPVMDKFMKLAGGDVNKAAKLAQDRGWK